MDSHIGQNRQDNHIITQTIMLRHSSNETTHQDAADKTIMLGHSRCDNYITKDGTVTDTVHHNTLDRMVTLGQSKWDSYVRTQ